MFSKLLNAFGYRSEFSTSDAELTKKQTKLIDGVNQVIHSTYSPYGEFLLDSNFPITFLNGKKNRNIAALSTEALTQKITSIQFGVYKNNPYVLANRMEHEGLHYNQYVRTPNFRLILELTPEAIFKRNRAMEFEAYSQNVYKLFKDCVSGHIPLTHKAFGDNIEFIVPFMEAYTGKKLEEDIEIITAELDKIKATGTFKKEEHVIPNFMLWLSQDKDYLEKIAKHEVRNMDYYAGALELNDTKINYRQELMEYFGINTLFTCDFGLNEINGMYNRNGKNYLGQLNNEQRKLFLKNISNLTEKEITACGIFRDKIKQMDLL